MTKRAVEWARALLVSPELVSVALILGATYQWPALALRLGSLGRFDEVDGWVLALAAAPLTLVGLTYNSAMKVLRPETGREALIEWPDYWRLRIQVLAALIWAGVGALAWMVGGLLVQLDSILAGTAIAISGIASSAVATVTTGLARLEVQDALDGAPTGDA